MMPSQKWGTESPESARRLAAASTTVPLRTAETMPAGMPIRSAMAIEQTASSAVAASVQAEAPEADDPVRVGREALDLGAQAGEHAPMPQDQPWHVALDDLGGLVVELLALARVRDLAGPGQQRVHVGIAVVAVVLGALARREGEDVAVGVGAAAPEGEVGLEIAAPARLQHRDVLLGLDRHGDAGLRQHGLQDQRRFLPITLRGHDQREGQGRLAGLAQELSGPGHV